MILKFPKTMFEMHSIEHLERCKIARCMKARLIDARLEGPAAEAAYGELAKEAESDYAQRPWLLVQQSKMIH